MLLETHKFFKTFLGLTLCHLVKAGFQSSTSKQIAVGLN